MAYHASLLDEETGTGSGIVEDDTEETADVSDQQMADR